MFPSSSVRFPRTEPAKSRVIESEPDWDAVVFWDIYKDPKRIVTSLRILIGRVAAEASRALDPSIVWASAPDWLDRRRAKSEIIAGLLFLGIFFVPPLFLTDIYPLTRTPVFSDAPRQFYLYEVTDPSGKPIPPATFHLNYTYDGNPLNVGFGYALPPPIARIDERRDGKQVAAWVLPQLAKHPDLAYVIVTQKVIGSLGQPIGVIRSDSWRISNPDYTR
jgi:hypothetical protein